MVDPIPGGSKTEEEIADLVAELGRKIRRASISALPGMTPGRLRALRRIHAAAGPIRMGELAQALDVAPRSVTTVVDDLAEIGLVQRIPDPDDRRVTLVTTTDKGRRLLTTAEKVRSKVAVETLDPLSSTELTTLHTLLTRAASGS